MASNRSATRWPYDVLFLWFVIPIVVLVFLLVFVPRATTSLGQYVAAGSSLIEILEVVPVEGGVPWETRLRVAYELSTRTQDFSEDAAYAAESLARDLRATNIPFDAKLLSDRLHEVYRYSQIRGEVFDTIDLFRWAPIALAFLALVTSLLGLRYLLHVYVDPLGVVLTSLREGAFRSTNDALPAYSHSTVRRLGASITRVELKIQEVVKPYEAQDLERHVLHQLLGMLQTPAWVMTRHNRILTMNDAAFEVMGSDEGDLRRDELRALVEIAGTVREDTCHEWDFDPNAEGWEVEELIVGEIWLFLRSSVGGHDGTKA